jgi:hypothetical protein
MKLLLTASVLCGRFCSASMAGSQNSVKPCSTVTVAASASF